MVPSKDCRSIRSKLPVKATVTPIKLLKCHSFINYHIIKRVSPLSFDVILVILLLRSLHQYAVLEENMVSVSRSIGPFSSMCFFYSRTLDIWVWLKIKNNATGKKKSYPRMNTIRKMSENIHLYISRNNWFPDWKMISFVEAGTTALKTCNCCLHLEADDAYNDITCSMERERNK